MREIALSRSDIRIVYPVHLNPNVREPVNRIISNTDNIYLIDTLIYSDFIKLIDSSYLIVTDSSGIQEEASSLGKPVLVTISSTERPEAFEAGTVELVGVDKHKIINSIERLLNDKNYYEVMSKVHNPYGDGEAVELILSAIIKG